MLHPYWLSQTNFVLSSYKNETNILMNSREILALKQRILICLSKKELKEAFEILTKLVVNTQDWKTTETLNQLESNYKYMLHYIFQGIKDPERDKVYNSLIQSLYELTDDVTDELLLLESPNYFYERLRLDALKNKNITDFHTKLKELTSSLSLIDLLESGDEKNSQTREIAVKRERMGVDLFNVIYTSPRAKKSNYEEYIQFLNSYDISTREKCIFISALTLNIFHRFDAFKVQILLDAATSETELIRARAIVGLVVILQMYDNRWSLYPELQNRLETLSEDDNFKKAILRVIIQLIRSRDTERISKKLSEEIIPQMMKFSNRAGKKISMDDLMGETDFMDKNPEWQKELEESGLSKKLQEYSELQMEGADVFHSTFSSLKSFPFFSEMSNWFLPFDRTYSEISELFPHTDKDNLLNMAIVDSGHMCNSDKYSFSLSLLQIPSSQREMMMTKMGAESEEVKRMQQDAKALNPTINEEVISNQYIQDLYRFYKLNPRRENFFDIFKLSLNFYEKKALLPLISDTNSMQQIANYCFDKNNFDVALSIFQLIVKRGNDTDSIWQKIGYCQQMLNNNSEALEAYLRSDLLASGKSWTLRRIAQLYRTLNQPQEALDYFEKAKQITPDNLSLELNIGHCHLELGDYESALNCYFKVEMLDSKSNKAHRPIAWTAFLLKKYDISQKYYDKILLNKPTLHDYLNAGHLELAMNKGKKALEHYRDAALLADNMDHFMSLVLEDKNTLIANGVEEEIFPYLFDKIKYILD